MIGLQKALKGVALGTNRRIGAVTGVKLGIVCPIKNGLAQIVKAKNASMMDLNQKAMDKGVEYAMKA